MAKDLIKIGDRVQVLNECLSDYGVHEGYYGVVKEISGRSGWVDFIYPDGHRDFWSIDFCDLSLAPYTMEDCLKGEISQEAFLSQNPEMKDQFIGAK